MTRRRASTHNGEVVRVDPLDVDAIAAGTASRRSRLDDGDAVDSRRAGVGRRPHVAQRRPRPPGGVAMKVALDVSAVPTATRGRRSLHRGTGATRCPAHGVDTTLVTRRDDDAAVARLVAGVVRGVRRAQRPRVATALRSVGAGHERHCARRSTSGTRRTTRCRIAVRRPRW